MDQYLKMQEKNQNIYKQLWDTITFDINLKKKLNYYQKMWKNF